MRPCYLDELPFYICSGMQFMPHEWVMFGGKHTRLFVNVSAINGTFRSAGRIFADSHKFELENAVCQPFESNEIPLQIMIDGQLSVRL